jgi:dienelactone hydrolase
MVLTRVLLILALAALTHPAAAQVDDTTTNPNAVPPAPLHEQVLHLAGDPDRPVDLVVTFYTPEGTGPFPLAIINHGANGTREQPHDMARHRYTYLAYYFLSRGYAVAMPMARGYNASGGQQANYICDFGQLAVDNGRDIEGVISDLAAFPQVDATRVVVAGQSFGGWNALGLGALNPPGVHGMIDFFGGVHSTGCKPTKGDEVTSLVDGARRLGAATTTPSLWFYGQNDSLFPPKTWDPMYKVYTREGGQAELVDVGSFMDDSHQMLSHLESFPLWVPKVDAFLEKIGLPNREIFPEYMPLPVPKPTHFAALTDVNAVPWVGASGRAVYQQFLAKPLPRVFVIATGGQSEAVSSTFDPLGRALEDCRKHGWECRPYAYDDEVVWSPMAPAPQLPATHFAAIDDVQAVPNLNEQGRAAYARFLAEAPPRSFVVSASGQSVATHGGADPTARALKICAEHGVTCRPYAVDNEVVWVPPPPVHLPPATGYAKLADVNAVPWINARGREAYAHFLTLKNPRAFVIATSGASASAQGGYDPLGRALSLCERSGLTCRGYAVNDQVIWPLRGK